MKMKAVKNFFFQNSFLYVGILNQRKVAGTLEGRSGLSRALISTSSSGVLAH